MVSYTRTTWADGSTGNTPITAARLNNIEAALALIAPLVNAGGGANTITLVETSGGYAQTSNGTPVTTPVAGMFYRFIGLSTPPFQRDGDGWIKMTLGVAGPWETVSTDSFNDGAALTPAATAPLKTKWTGDRSYWIQTSDGNLTGTGWPSTGQFMVLVDSTPAAQRMAAELTSRGYTGNTSPRILGILLNAPSTNLTASTLGGYSVQMSVDGGVAAWTCTRRVNGTATPIGSPWTEPQPASPFMWRAESDGAGNISLLREGNLVKTWDDPDTALTGVYAGVLIYNSGGVGAVASANFKADDWQVDAG